MNIDGAKNEDLKRAVEALRSGVPTRAAVQFLGCGQTTIEDRFRAKLADARSAVGELRQPAGMLVEGEFGSGKSHLLEYLQYIALEEKFICSHVVISKETPLHDPAKVYAAAVESAIVPGRTGQMFQELVFDLKKESPAYRDLFVWANSEESGLATLFPATLLLWERLHGDPDLTEKIVGFWSGEKLPIADVRSGLKQIGQSSTFPVRAVPTKHLAEQRPQFAPQLIRAAGYAGWIILIDEVELVGRYSRLQRAKSYAELARWLGRDESSSLPGILAVGAITVAFASQVLQEKEDRDLVGPLLRSKDTDESRAMASRAETGMRVIDREALKLKAPDDEMLDQTYQTLKAMHGAAYRWDAPDVPWAERAMARQMRSYVRRWINEWDLTRLYPGERVTTEEQEMKEDFTEDPDLEHASGEDASDITEADGS